MTWQMSDPPGPPKLVNWAFQSFFQNALASAMQNILGLFSVFSGPLAPLQNLSSKIVILLTLIIQYNNISDSFLFRMSLCQRETTRVVNLEFIVSTENHRWSLKNILFVYIFGK